MRTVVGTSDEVIFVADATEPVPTDDTNETVVVIENDNDDDSLSLEPSQLVMIIKDHQSRTDS